MPLEYVVEAAPLGTGGAIRAALPFLHEERALVLNGDTYLPIDFRAMMEAAAGNGAEVTMAVVEQPDVARYGEVVLANGRVTGFREKGRSGRGWINGGVYCLPKSLAWPESLAEKFSFETDFMMAEIGRLKVAAFVTVGAFLDIGVPEDLDRAADVLGVA